MAGRPKKVTEENVVEQSNQNEINYTEENKKLKEEISQLKSMFEQLMQKQNEPKNPLRVGSIIVEDEIVEIPPNKLINITSLFYGGMTLKASNNKKIRFDKFGVTLPVTFEDLTYICSNHRNLAEEGSFFIHNQDAVKALYLESNYEKIVNKSTIENLISLSHDQIESVYTELTDSLKETVEDIIIQGIISNNSKFSDRGKIDLISKLCGKNLFKLAQDFNE